METDNITLEFTGTVAAVYENTSFSKKKGFSFKRIQVYCTSDEGSKIKFNTFGNIMREQLQGEQLQPGDRVRVTYSQATSEWRGKQKTFNNLVSIELLNSHQMQASDSALTKLDQVMTLLKEVKSLMAKTAAQGGESK